jgi:hypothetical protein
MIIWKRAFETVRNCLILNIIIYPAVVSNHQKKRRTVIHLFIRLGYCFDVHMNC